jgi:DNA-binding protein HU-beta
MNKAELIEAVATEVGLTKVQAAAALDQILHSVGAALKSGDKVTLVGFGTFSTGTRAARIGRNPRDNQPIKIAAKTVAKFKAGKELSDLVNGAGKKKK